MSLEPFVDSKPFTFGIELEMQIVNTHDYDLTKAGSDLMRLIKDEKIPGNITPEITESMIELSTGICKDFDQARSVVATIGRADVAKDVRHLEPERADGRPSEVHRTCGGRWWLDLG